MTLFVISILVGVDGEIIAYAGESVTLTLKDGRVLSGAVDEPTDNHRLWLRFTAPSMTMSMSTEWNDIASIRHHHETMTVAQFRPRALKLKSKLPDDFFPTDLKQVPKSTQRETGLHRERLTHRSKVRSLYIQVELANFDSDLAADGFIVHVYPLDARGKLVAVDGTINVRLISQRLRGIVRTREFPELGRWSHPVRKADFATRKAAYRFRFQQSEPEFDLEFADQRNPWSSQSEPYGQINARLDVPGQGSFRATIPIWLRSYSPLREELQLQERTRFFPHERVHRGAG